MGDRSQTAKHTVTQQAALHDGQPYSESTHENSCWSEPGPMYFYWTSYVSSTCKDNWGQGADFFLNAERWLNSGLPVTSLEYIKKNLLKEVMQTPKRSLKRSSEPLRILGVTYRRMDNPQTMPFKSVVPTSCHCLGSLEYRGLVSPMTILLPARSSV